MESNRFARPGAQLDDVGEDVDGHQPVRLWLPRGRIGRMRFPAYSDYAHRAKAAAGR